MRPTAEAPWPVVKMARLDTFSTYLRNCDLAVPGSPHSSTLMSPLTLCLPPAGVTGAQDGPQPTTAAATGFFRKRRDAQDASPL